MNGGAVADATKDLGVRFRFVSLLPVAALAAYVLALTWSGAPGRSPDLGAVTRHAQHIAGWATFLLLVAAVVVALIAEPLQITLVRLLEGYWGQSLAGRLLAAPGTAYHRARRRRLDARQRRGPHDGPVSSGRREQAARRLRDYPPADAVLPTKLGNVLRAAEYQAGRSYGLDAISLWPRLYPLLADKTAAVVDDLRDQLDLAARFCSVFLLATVITVACLAPYGWWLTVAAGTLAAAVLSYQAALSAASAYGHAVAAAFDLHRFDLLRALHLPLPPNLLSEVQANQQLSRFMGQPQEYLYALTHGASALNFTYAHDGEPRPGGDPGEETAATSSREPGPGG